MISDARFQRVKAIFLAAVEAPDSERSRIVSDAAADDPELVADVLALLDHHARPSALLRETPVSAIEVKPLGDGLPLTMGRYVLERLLGEGATGRVFAATQRNPRRPVAIKLLKPGLQSQKRNTERFLREADLLAKLDHPGIARVYESGVAGLPWGPQAFIAMEFIDGVPLTAYAQLHKLSLQAKLELLAKVCDAVEYSHQHGVIHRDLKPSNVLVCSDGQPRVLDFGVAHALYDETGTQLSLGSDLVGTLAYMSPEYAQGKDPGGIRSDVYSLGVMAYELISGVRPVVTEGNGLWEAMEAIREHKFPSLRQRVPQCGVDLNLVVDKALRLEASDRYQTAGALAADLRRVIESRPVSVRRPTPLYRFSRLLRRTPKRSVAAVALIALMLVGGGLSLRQWLVTRNKLQELNLFRAYEKALPSYRPGGWSADQTVEKLQAISRHAQSTLQSHPSVEAEVQARVGAEYYESLGRFAEAEKALRRAGELSANRPLRDPLVYDLVIRLAAVSAWRDKGHEVEEPLRKLIQELDRSGGDPQKLYHLRRQLAWSMVSRGPSEELDKQMLAIEQIGKDPLGNPRWGWTTFDLRCIRAASLYFAGNAQDAERLLPSADEIKSKVLAEPWQVTYRSTARIAGLVQAALGRYEVAEDVQRVATQAALSEQGPKSFEVVSGRISLAGLHWLKKDFSTAEQEFADIASITGPDGLNEPVLRGNALNSRGVCLRDLGRLAEAEAALLEALSIRRAADGPDSMVVGDTQLNVATVHIRKGRGREALECIEDAERIRRVRGQWVPQKEAETRAMKGQARALIDGPSAALEELRAAWQVRWDAGLLANWQTNIAVDALLDALVALGLDEEARRITEQEYAKLVETAGPENAATKRAAERREALTQRLSHRSK